MDDRYTSMSFKIPIVLMDELSGILHSLGSIGIQEESSANSGYLHVTAYFDSAQLDMVRTREAVTRALAQAEKGKIPAIEFTPCPDIDWDKVWRKRFKPFELVKGVVICPSWEEYRPGPDQTLISLDPSMAFGTGLHETTRLCAQMIYDEAKSSSPTSFLDVGTGSGILAIVAKRLGVPRVSAVENDGDAALVAMKNFKANGLSDIELKHNIEETNDSYEIVVANILLNTLLSIRESLERRVSPNGLLILSGITGDQEHELMKSFSDLTLQETRRDGEWSAISLRGRR
jgi:ribosomal protein L11 methyltransferase